MAQSLVQSILLPENVNFYSDGTEESLARWLQWYTIAVTHFLPIFHFFLLHVHFLRFCTCYIWLLLFDQAVQLTHVLDERLKELAEDIEKEKALKDVAADTAKEKGKATDVVDKKAKTIEKAQLATEKKLV